MSAVEGGTFFLLHSDKGYFFKRKGINFWYSDFEHTGKGMV